MVATMAAITSSPSASRTMMLLFSAGNLMAVILPAWSSPPRLG